MILANFFEIMVMQRMSSMVNLIIYCIPHNMSGWLLISYVFYGDSLNDKWDPLSIFYMVPSLALSASACDITLREIVKLRKVQQNPSNMNKNCDVF